MAELYNYLYPTSQKASYTSGDQVDFLLSFPNKSIVRNSVRISGSLQVNSTGTTILAGQKVYYDATSGVHVCFNNVTVSTQARGVIEIQQDYARYVKMRNMATKTTEQMISSGKLINELCMSDSTKTNAYLAQVLPFYVKPDVCLNNFNGLEANVGGIDYTQTGDITLSLRVSTTNEFLFGSDMNANVNFVLTNLAVEYQTVPLQGKPILMVVKSSIKQTLNSSNSTVSVSLPATANSISCSFMKVSEEADVQKNHIDCEKPDGISRLYYSFNGATGQYIGFPVDSVQDMIAHYLDSLHAVDPLAGRNPADRKNDITNQLLSEQKAFGVGLDFDTMSLAANSNFALNIMSNVVSDSPYYVYMYIHSIYQFGGGKK